MQYFGNRLNFGGKMHFTWKLKEKSVFFHYCLETIDKAVLGKIVLRATLFPLGIVFHMKSNYQHHMFGCMVGKSPAIKKVFEAAKKASAHSDNVLILGETGTGKDLLAREIHNKSNRGKSRFIPINCSAIPETLLESELFGYEKGAFTGANFLKEGKFEIANGGTVFLDEIGDMPLHCQAKILRTIDDKRIERLGCKKSVKIDVRFISATSHDLHNLIKKDRFRKDLFYRLDEETIRLPKLMERIEDIPLLAQFFIDQFKDPALPAKSISDAALGVLVSHKWPGNIRELRSAIKKALKNADHEQIWVEDLPYKVNEDSLSVDNDENKILPMKEFQKRYLKKVLDLQNWNKASSARLLEVSEKTIYNMIQEYNLSPP